MLSFSHSNIRDLDFMKFALSILLFCISGISASFAKELPLYLLKLPAGFHIGGFSEVPGAREMVSGHHALGKSRD